MQLTQRIAKAVAMDGEAWRRHANPWSVYTRFAAIPLMIAAIWSRVWIGWWALVPVALVVAWLFLNVKVFAPVPPESWTAKGIYGERLWLKDKGQTPSGHREVLRLLVATGIAGGLLMFWGLYALEPWATIMGMVVLVMAQLWRIDRFGLLFEERQRMGRT